MNLNIFENKRVVIAVSTGVDSMVLMHKMLQVNCEVFVCYVRHHHRERVQIENEFFTKYCLENNINLITFDYFHESGNFESVAREYRYKCFKEVYDKYKCQYLLTAHHGDDLVETMLMRQLRGTDVNGVGGFREFSIMNGMNVARPLLDYSKNDLRHIASDENIPYYEDETNADISYQRNFLRHEIIPKFGNGYIKKYVSLSKEMYELSDYIKDVVDKHIEVLTDIYLNLDDLDYRLYKYGIKKALHYLYGSDVKFVYDKHVKMIENMKDFEKIQIPKGYFVFKEPSRLIFTKAKESVYNYELKDNLHINFLNSSISFSDNGKDVIRLDDQVKFPLYVKNASMDMEINCHNGRQKLNRIFINCKVPRHKRTSWPVLVDSNNNVICIFGLKYSVFCLKDTSKYKYMLKYICIYKGDDYNA